MKNIFLFFGLFVLSVSCFGATFISSFSKNGSYTVPTGKYVRVLEATGDVVLNGIEIAKVSNMSLSQGGTGSSGGMFEVLAGDCVTITGANAFSVRLWGTHPTGNSTTAFESSLVTSTTSFASCAIQGKIIFSHGSFADLRTVKIRRSMSEFYAKSGDVISATKYFVELYER